MNGGRSIWTLVITIVPVLFSRLIYMLIEGVMSKLNTIDGTYGVNSYLINFTGMDMIIDNYYTTFLDKHTSP